MLDEGKTPQEIAKELNLSYHYVLNELRSRYSDEYIRKAVEKSGRTWEPKEKHRHKKPPLETLKYQSMLYTTSELARRYNVDPDIMRYWLRGYNLKAKKPKSGNAGKKKEIDIKLCIKQIASGVPKYQVAKMHGVSLATLYKRLNDAGYKENISKIDPNHKGVPCQWKNKYMMSCKYGCDHCCNYFLITGEQRKYAGEYCFSYEKRTKGDSKKPLF